MTIMSAQRSCLVKCMLMVSRDTPKFLVCTRAKVVGETNPYGETDLPHVSRFWSDKKYAAQNNSILPSNTMLGVLLLLTVL